MAAENQSGENNNGPEARLTQEQEHSAARGAAAGRGATADQLGHMKRRKCRGSEQPCLEHGDRGKTEDADDLT